MYVLMFLGERPAVRLQADDVQSFTYAGRSFRDIPPGSGDDFYLGFYDWLRTSDGVILGVTVTFHDGREAIQSVLPARPYTQWLAKDVLRIWLRRGVPDEKNSIDQDFSTTRCLRAPDGSVALLFDASDLSAEQLNNLAAAAGS